MKKLLAALAGVSILAALSFTAISQGKGTATPKEQKEAETETQAKQAPVSGWRTSCATTERGAALDCVVEQRVFVPQTRQRLVNVKVRVDGAERKPALMIATPLGLFLPAGVSIQIDQTEAKKLELQTCDAAGCYVGMPLTDALLDLMKAGNQFGVKFQDLAKQDINVTMPLEGFSAGMEKVK